MGVLLLSDLKPEIQQQYLDDILADPRLKKAYEQGEEIQVASIREFKKPRIFSY